MAEAESAMVWRLLFLFYFKMLEYVYDIGLDEIFLICQIAACLNGGTALVVMLPSTPHKLL